MDYVKAEMLLEFAKNNLIIHRQVLNGWLGR